MNGLIEELVRQIQDLQEEIAAPAVYGKSVSAKSVAERLDDLLQVEDPGGKVGTLAVDGYGWSIMLGSRITGERVISTDPEGFNGVVWSEEMNRAPREDNE
jgi:hypothetical protein